MDELAAVGLFALVFGSLNAVTYILAERSSRTQWVRDVVTHQPASAQDDAFRAADDHGAEYVGPQSNPRAPKDLRMIAMWSIGMGQMFVPGLLAGLFGLIVWGLGLVSIPGLILAMRIWRVGPALLRAEPTSVKRARSAARFAETLNVIILVLMVVGLLAMPDVGFVWLGTAIYAMISLAHAQGLRHAASTVEALWVERGYDINALDLITPAPRRAAPAPASV